MDMIPQDNTPRKQCSNPDCQKWFPATSEYFYRDKYRPDGLYSQCKECKNKKAEAYRGRPETKERVSVYNKIYHKEYYNQPENREHKRIQDKTYYERNRINIRDQAKLYYRRPEVHKRTRAQAKEYNRRPEVREHRLARQKFYRSNPEVRERERAQAKNYSRSLQGQAICRAVYRNYCARKKSIPGTHTASQIAEQLKRQHYRCYYAACGFAKFKKVNGKYLYEIEHTFPLSRVVGTDIPANDMSYLVLACPSCNSKKRDKFPHEWPEGGRLL